MTKLASNKLIPILFGISGLSLLLLSLGVVIIQIGSDSTTLSSAESVVSLLTLIFAALASAKLTQEIVKS